jgi:hypothetical protein
MGFFAFFATSGEAVPGLSRGLSDHSRRAAALKNGLFAIFTIKI